MRLSPRSSTTLASLTWSGRGKRHGALLVSLSAAFGLDELAGRETRYFVGVFGSGWGLFWIPEGCPLMVGKALENSTRGGFKIVLFYSILLFKQTQSRILCVKKEINAHLVSCECTDKKFREKEGMGSGEGEERPLLKGVFPPLPQPPEA